MIITPLSQLHLTFLHSLHYLTIDSSLHAAQQTLISHQKSETLLKEKLNNEKQMSSNILSDLEKIGEKHKVCSFLMLNNLNVLWVNYIFKTKYIGNET